MAAAATTNGTPARAATKAALRAATITFKEPTKRAPTTTAVANGANGTSKDGKEEPKVEAVYAEVTNVCGGVPGGFRDGKSAEAKLSQPIGIAYDKKKNVLLIADFLNHRIRCINFKTDEVSTIAGAGAAGDDNGQAYLSKFNGPRAVAVDPTDGSLVVVDANRLRRVRNGEVTHIAGAVDSNGDEEDNKDGTGEDARFEVPNGLAIDPATGVIYVADTGANQIRRVDPKSGAVTTVAGSGAEDESKDGPAKQAAIIAPMAIALDAVTQVLYISGEKGIRKYDIKADAVTTLATAEPLTCAGIALTGDGKHLVVTDTQANSLCAIALSTVTDQKSPLFGKHEVKRLTSAQDKAHAGAAPFNRPMGLAFDTTDDASRTVFVADTFGERIRKVVLPSGEIGAVGGDCRMCGSEGGCTVM